MKLGFAGLTHLGATHLIASVKLGFDVVAFDPGRKSLKGCDLVFVTQDVDCDADLRLLNCLLDQVLADAPAPTPIVLMSQVPPGYTRAWAAKRVNVFYQANTLIMNCALERAMKPEQIIVGEPDPAVGFLPRAYAEYFDSFKVPVHRMTYESAEFAKLAINTMLGSQIATASSLSAAAVNCGAEWNDVVKTLKGDKRIGPHAYLNPGTIGGHLPRDIERVKAMLPNDRFAQAL